ncbi:YqgE/AlgH family protein [unidentified bacterial endosymbiont]|uniref:YqgE/AlgH family protein n=1 Tax=unidentified bacterial endosymbiont TaxID=2355 RepID=UPI00209CFC67|nr:YqgE/AlgH family protein [unidentified bacterial endosymbiont]
MRLHHHFLIALPTLQDPFFKQSVVYLCDHTEQGAMGIVINHPLTLTVQALLQQLKIEKTDTPVDYPVFNGGPVANDRGFILHSPQAGFSSSLSVSSETMLTNSRDILETLGTAEQPPHFLVALGYASWQQGQLEQELSETGWLVTPADPAIIFHTPINQRWQAAVKQLGIQDAWQIVSQGGHA